MTDVTDVLLDTRQIEMDGTEFTGILAVQSWTQGTAASILGVSIRTVNAWANGKTPIPHSVAKVLRAIDHGRVTWIPE